MIDKTAFCDLIRLHEKTMYSLAYSVVGNEADAEDVICESILRAYKNIDMLKNEKAFKTWVLRIVHNTAIELIRKNSKTISLENVEIEEKSHEDDMVTKLSLKAAIECLDKHYRMVVTLFYFENLSVAQIAKITGTSTVTIKQRLSRARKKLYEILKEN